MKRKPLSKKIRFEVFKRDKFTCQYCGRQAPNVVLECDHIHPVADGGDDDLMNLITSCFDCNRGKSKTLISDDSAILKRKKQADLQQQRLEQLEMMHDWQIGLLNAEEKCCDMVCELFEMYFPKLSLNENGRKIVRDKIRQFGYCEVYDAAKISFSKYKVPEEAVNKIGGICYNIRKQRSGNNGVV